MLTKPFLVLLFLLCHFVIRADGGSEEFYILPMGQGSAQLVVYHANEPDKRLGLLYDLGSKSLQTHPKFAKRGPWKTYFVPKVVATAPQAHKEVISTAKDTPKKITKGVTLDEETPEGQKPRPSVTGNITTERTLDPQQRDALKDELKDFILEVLGGLNHLVLLASHTDLDHINFIGHDFIPDKLPITAFLCGDWFGDSCSSVDKETSRVVKDVIGFLGRRKKTHLEFPYYWNFSVPDPTKHKGKVPFNQYVRAMIKDSGKGTKLDSSLKELGKLCSRKQLLPPAPEPIAGTLKDLLDKTDIDDSVKQDAALNVVWDNTYVWSLNLPVSDVNDCSLIISCSLPSLNLSVILTGDAGLPVFQSVLYLSKGKSFMSIVNASKTPNHMVLMMLPHHGSHHNISGHMLGFFQPNVFGIAAGNGAQHGHPSLTTIEWIREASKGAQSYKDFWQKWLENKPFRFITINEESDQKKYPHKVLRSTVDNPVFLCPNMYGCIKWNGEGVYSNFSSALQYKGNDYGVDYVTYAFEVEKTIFGKDDKEGYVFEGAPPKGKKIKLQYIEKLGAEHTPYKHLCCRKTDKASLFVGIAQDEKVVFYRLIGDGKALSTKK